MQLDPVIMQVGLQLRRDGLRLQKQIRGIRPDQKIGQRDRTAGNVASSDIESPHDVIQSGQNIIAASQFLHFTSDDGHLFRTCLSA